MAQVLLRVYNDIDKLEEVANSIIAQGFDVLSVSMISILVYIHNNEQMNLLKLGFGEYIHNIDYNEVQNEEPTNVSNATILGIISGLIIALTIAEAIALNVLN